MRISLSEEGLYQSFKNYISEGYNFLDFFGEVLYLAYCIEKLVNATESRFIEYMHIVALLLLFIRAISHLRVIESTRYLIRMIT